MKNKWLLVTMIILLAGIFLRVYQLTSSPPSLYWEEAALGYDAYSILKTGQDHHGHPWPIIAFESFGDWKPSLYFYYLIPFIWIGGLTPLAVKSSGVVLGILLLIGIATLAKQLKISVVAALSVAACSPWAIHFSRSAWEAHLATVLILWGVILWKFASQTKSWWLWASSSICLALATYAYHSARLIVPLLVVAMVIVTNSSYLRRIPRMTQMYKEKLFTQSFMAAVLTALIMLPLLLSLFGSGSGEITHRFQETGLTSDLSIIQQSNQLKDEANNSLASRIVFHRYLLMSRAVISNIFSYTSLDFWLINGDQNLRHSPGYIGHIYIFEILFLIWGLIEIVRKKQPWLFFLVAWLLIAILPAALAKPNPHALRILPMMPALLLIIGIGLSSSFKWLLQQFNSYNHIRRFSKTLTILIFAGVYLLGIIGFYRHYLKIYPIESAEDWQYGYQQVVAAIQPFKNDGRHIVMSRSLGRPAMYVWFYSQEDPQQVQMANSVELKDQAEFISYNNFDFVRSVTTDDLKPSSILVFTKEEAATLPAEKLDIKDQIFGLNGEVIWMIAEVKS